MLSFPDYLNQKKDLVNQALNTYLPEAAFPQQLQDAMRYSVMAGGKRIRAIMAVAASELCGGSADLALPVACALEMVHTYSLIHDDLPAMDNDDLRRGRPTNHKVFGEAVAILAGDTLMTYAYHLIAREYAKMQVPSALTVRLIEEIGEATGILGMAGGQVLDLDAENKSIPYELLKKIHELKTGALIKASVRCGAIVAGADNATLEALTMYAHHLGIVFQIVDDILDVTSTTEVLGKPVGSDERNQKTTYVSLFGLEKARKMAGEEADTALEYIGTLGQGSGFFVDLVHYFLNREL